MKKEHFILSLIGILVLGVVMSLAFYFPNRPDNSDNNKNCCPDEDRFSVTGSGTVYAKADIANLTVGLKTEVKKTAAEVTKKNSEKMNEIIAVVKELGVEEKDIKTTNYQLSPVYTWIDREGQKLLGYEVSQNITLKIRDLDKISEIIARTTEKGANQIGGINFTIDDEYDLKNEARKIAIAKAKEKAIAIAAETGMELGKIKGVLETNYQPVTYSNAYKTMGFLEMDRADSVVTPSIEVGQNEVKVEVTLIYEVK
ncbi:MAG: SIMPL domain-containing protein [Patescibacteria group bacterium]|jgi:hypothetical protein|nr:SIMPL domain-containing protein [bacterium]HQC49600.1 SIMPL domain-containing protein [bacterium]